MTKRLNTSLSKELAWGIAAAAYRINGGYFKYIDDGKKPNTELIYEILDNPELMLTEDLDRGAVIRDYIAKTVTMATLRGTLDVWGQEMARVAQLETIEDKFSLHVIASMPQTYARYLQREKAHQRLSETVDHTELVVGDKVEITAEVVENKYSTKWSCHYITVVDTENRAWFFAHQRSLPKGSQHVFRGTVKRIQDRMVQLNRVKIINKEEV